MAVEAEYTFLWEEFKLDCSQFCAIFEFSEPGSSWARVSRK
jgi:hypothetical protein